MDKLANGIETEIRVIIQSLNKKLWLNIAVLLDQTVLHDWSSMLDDESSYHSKRNKHKSKNFFKKTNIYYIPVSFQVDFVTDENEWRIVGGG